MAKTKAARGGRKSSKKAGKKAASKRAKLSRKAPARKASARRKAASKPGRKKTAKRTAKKAAKKAPRVKARVIRKAAARKPARKAQARNAQARKAPAQRPAPARKPASARKTPASAKAAAGKRKPLPRNAATAKLNAEAAKKIPALNRERRRLAETDGELMPSSPSSLGYASGSSAARSGRGELRESLTQHTETSPALTGGDIDADWEDAYAVGDEAPGGDNPTPDQDRVDDIGKALGVQYNDNEELKGAEKIIERDRHRWELDPASSDDYKDRGRDEED